jgi:hypothetical protein
VVRFHLPAIVRELTDTHANVEKALEHVQFR